MDTNHDTRRRTIVTAGILLGLGLGGFVDGIVLHQVLQWHHLLSAVEGYPTTTVAGLEANTFADGLFHLTTWSLTGLGIGMLWHALQAGPAVWHTRAFLGTLLLGCGLFNLFDSVLNHWLLGLHHIRQDPGVNELAYDLGFFVWGAAMVGLGLGPIRLAGTPTPQPGVRRDPGTFQQRDLA